MLKAVERASLRLNQVDRASLRRESMGRTILRGNLNRASFRKGRRHIVQFLEIFVIVHGFTRIYIFFLQSGWLSLHGDKSRPTEVYICW